MYFLAHRGLWTHPNEKNSQIALSRAFDHSFGIETDLRDHCGQIVIAHDKPTGEEMTFEDFLALLPPDNTTAIAPLALNIKADGLAADIANLMRRRSALNWFAFDMSVPDMVSYIRAGLPVFTRLSDYESEPIAYGDSVGLWIDGFSHDWSDFTGLEKYLVDGKKIALVSPELHGRSYESFWTGLRDSGLCTHSDVMLCTDLPLEAKEFFTCTVP